MTYALTTNQHSFDGRHLNSADHDTVLRIFGDHVEQAGPGGEPFKVALRAIDEVRAVAWQHGWKPGPAERLATYAALVYGALLKDAADDLRIGR